MMKYLFALYTTLITSLLFSQSNFYKQYSGSGYDYANGVIELPDRSYLITGSSSSFMDAPSQMFILHLDSLGNFLRSKDYGGSESDIGVRVIYVPTEGYFVGGYTNSEGAGNYDFALWKLDTQFEPLWMKTYGTPAWERVHDMIINENNELIMVGETTNTQDGFSDSYIVKVDLSGELIWDYQSNIDGEDITYTISKFETDNYIIGGIKYNTTTNRSESAAKRIDDNGATIWEKTWGSNKHHYLRDLTVYNQTIYTVGYVTSNTIDSAQLHITLLDATTGNITITKTEQSIGEAGYAVTNYEYIDAFAIGATNSGQYSFGLDDVFFLGFNIVADYFKTPGKVQYQTNQSISDMQTTYLRGFVAVGNNQHIGPGGSTIYIYRNGAFSPEFNSNEDMIIHPIVSISNVSQDGETIQVYPNPAYNEVKIITANQNNLCIQILDINGKVILTRNKVTNSTIDISSLEKGIYFLVTEDEKDTKTVIKIEKK